MINLDTIRGYLDPEEIEVNESNIGYYTNVLEGTVEFLEEYCSIEVTDASKTNILLVLSKLFRYNLFTRPHIADMRTEDMRLIFSTDYPKNLMRDLAVLRRVTW